MVETLKRAEEGRGGILFLFEAEGSACRCGLEVGGSPCRIEQTNMLEETEALLLERGAHLNLTPQAFGIVTLRGDPVTSKDRRCALFERLENRPLTEQIMRCNYAL